MVQNGWGGNVIVNPLERLMAFAPADDGLCVFVASPGETRWITLRSEEIPEEIAKAVVALRPVYRSILDGVTAIMKDGRTPPGEGDS